MKSLKLSGSKQDSEKGSPIVFFRMPLKGCSVDILKERKKDIPMA